MKGEAVEIAAKCTTTVGATHHHSGLSCVLVMRTSAKQMSGKAALVCYCKPTCKMSSSTGEKDFQEQKQVSEASFGMGEKKACFTH